MEAAVKTNRAVGNNDHYGNAVWEARAEMARDTLRLILDREVEVFVRYVPGGFHWIEAVTVNGRTMRTEDIEGDYQ